MSIKKESSEKLICCPFCKGKAYIVICDKEGNLNRDEDYENDPWSGLGYQLVHPIKENPDCPIAMHEDETIGTQIYDTEDEAVSAWNKRSGGG